MIGVTLIGMKLRSGHEARRDSDDAGDGCVHAVSENGKFTYPWCYEAANRGRGGEERFGRIPCVVLEVWDYTIT